MLSKTIDNIARFLKMPFLLILFSYLTLNALYNLKGLDYFFHIKSGEYIVTQKEFPRQDIFSFTMENKEWNNHEWFYQVLIYSLYKHFGLNGLFFLKITVFMLAFFILVLMALKIDWFVSFIILFFGLKVTFFRFTLRPDNLSFLFFILYLAPFVFKQRKILFLLPLIQLLWVNIHGFFFLGPLILIIYLLTARINKRELDIVFYNTAKLILLLSIIVCFLNPQPVATFTYPFKILGNIFSGTQRPFYESIRELQSPFRVFPLDSLFFKYLIFMSIPVIVLKNPNIFYTCLWLVMFFFSLNAVRNFYFFVPVGMVIFIDRYPYIKEFLLNKIFKEKWFWLLKMILIILLIMIATITGKHLVFSPQKGRSYLDLEKDNPLQIKSRFLGYAVDMYPQNMVSFIKRHNLPDRMFNNFNFGAYGIFNFFPDRKVFIDGRAEFYGPSFFNFYSKIMDADESAFKEALEKYKLEGFILSYARDEQPPPLLRLLYKEGYKCVYFDRDGIIFLKDDFINKHESLKSSIVDFKTHKLKKIDLIKDIKLYNPSMHGYYVMANVLYLLDFDEQSKQYLREVLKVAPAHAHSYYLLARIHYKNKEYDEAFLNCRNSIYFDLGFKRARMLLARIYLKTNNVEDAKKTIEGLKINFKKFLQGLKEE